MGLRGVLHSALKARSNTKTQGEENSWMRNVSNSTFCILRLSSLLMTLTAA